MSCQQSLAGALDQVPGTMTHNYSGSSANGKCMATEDIMVFCGNLVHATKEEPMVILRDHVIGVRGNLIIFVEPKARLAEMQQTYSFSDADVRYLKNCEFVIPGFVDTHIHAPQYAITGTGTDIQLLDWLDTYAFPVEAKFSNLDFAQDVYTKAVRRTLMNGTTTASYFATIHTDASLLLCDIIGDLGQRAYVGKVNMDQESPDYYVESTQESIDETKRFINQVEKKKNPLVQACITPRFAITCSSHLMEELGRLAKEHDLPIQSHLAENKDEIDMVGRQHPDKTYAEVYDQHKLLSDRCIMAHCVHLGSSDLDLLHKRSTGISHCPNSNITIRSGLMDMKLTLDHKVKLALGTDVSGGYHPSILDAMRSAMSASNIKWFNEYRKHNPFTYKDFFRLATLGGSEVMGLDDKIGNFVVGKEFDALYIDAVAAGSPFNLFSVDKLEDVIQKFFLLGDDRNIKEVYVSGRKVVPFAE